MLWWASKWLEVIAEGKVQQTDFSIAYCQSFLLRKVEEMKPMPEDEKVLHMTDRDYLIMIDVEQHLDNWVLAREFDEMDRKRSNGARKRGK